MQVLITALFWHSQGRPDWYSYCSDRMVQARGKIRGSCDLCIVSSCNGFW